MDIVSPRWQKAKVVILMGATGTGKSRLSMDLATQFPAEIINSDKMQVFKGLEITTNKISEEERFGIPHHLLGEVNPNADFTAKDFCSMASLAIESVSTRGLLPIVVGGSNSYIEALVDDDDYRFRSKYECCFLWVDASMSVLNDFLCKRVDEMVSKGMVDEVRKIFDPYADYSKGIRRSIGVPELDKYLRDEAFSNGENCDRLILEAIQGGAGGRGGIGGTNGGNGMYGSMHRHSSLANWETQSGRENGWASILGRSNKMAAKSINVFLQGNKERNDQEGESAVLVDVMEEYRL
ncbi:hypothetical protein GH714_024637 [Hevea brasiliensis]|uniref:Adenylate isopentenyltransferase n=1 Tax=Hevea brasiliensis TaxID=3981 RepID=A0A6A6NIV2_HEVBR|nr:hypothetical protein GH714_024637 [Hevea brasiliensis]